MQGKKCRHADIQCNLLIIKEIKMIEASYKKKYDINRMLNKKMANKYKIQEISESGLVKHMSLLDATLFVMGSVLGSGIFMTSGHIIKYVGNEKNMLLIWLGGGIFTLIGGLCLANLGVAYPKAGGPYVYLKEIYGKWAGFLFGWIFFWIIESGGIAALSVGFSDHLINLLGIKNINLSQLQFSPLYKLKIFLVQIVAIFPIIGLSIINHYGIRLAILIQNISIILRIGLILALVSGGFIALNQKNLLSIRFINNTAKPGGLENYLLAMLAALWTYDGWYAANCTAEEMKRPEKDLPKAIILGIIGITIIYLMINFLYVIALTAEEMSGKDRIGELASISIFGPRISLVIRIGIALTIFGCLSSTIIYGPRVYFAMAKDKVFFEKLGQLNKKTRVPSRAIWAQAILASFLCLFGQFQALYEYVVFSLLIFFAALGLAIFLRKRKQKDVLTLILAGIFIIACLSIYLICLRRKTKEVVLGLLITISGYPAFLYWDKKAKYNKNII